MNNPIRKIGRNERCPCGSGKTYKHFHLAADEQRHRESIPKPAPAEPPHARANIADLPGLLKQFSQTGPVGKPAEFADLMAKAGPVIAYIEKQEEIDAASATLEAHRAEFEKKLADQEACRDWTGALFAEECFAPLRFSAADVRRAFDQVGYPAKALGDKRTAEIVRAAILHLADRECRANAAMSLLVQMAAFVAAGRHMDAWMIQLCATQTMERDQESNAFLLAMFGFGYEAWMAEQHAKSELALRKMGINPEELSGMGLTELDEWIQAQRADSPQGAQFEAFLAEHPDVRAEAIARVEAMERDSVKLLDRPDTGFLLLTPAELAPWLERVNQVLKSTAERCPPEPDGTLAPAIVTQIFEESILPALPEMAGTIFTPARLKELLDQITEYRKRLLAAGDRDAARWAMGAITSLERETEPEQNYFLANLCLASFKKGMAG